MFYSKTALFELALAYLLVMVWVRTLHSYRMTISPGLPEQLLDFLTGTICDLEIVGLDTAARR